MTRIVPLVCSLLLFLGSAAPAQEPPSPSGVITELNSALLEVMQTAEDLGYQGRYDKLAPVLSRSFDFAAMARISVGGHWRKLETEQRRRLVDSFSRMSTATFAARFNGYSGERMEVLGEEEGLRKSILVRNQLVQADGEVIPLHYQLRKTRAGWRIVDVYLDGKFSELATKRNEYSSVISRDGFEGLIAVIEKKIAELKAG